MKPVPERTAAKEAGERFYFTGKACRNGHVVKRYTSSGLCSACATKNVKAWAAKQPEHPARIAARASSERYYSTGKPCPHGHDRRWVSNGVCTECGVKRSREWDARNPDYDHAGMARKSRAKDPTGHRKASGKWAKNNPEKHAAALVAWRDANREWYRAYHRAYQAKRKLRKAANGGFYTPKDVEELRVLQNDLCAACRRKTKLEVDHILAVVRGGTNARSNLQLLCRKCNASKGAKDMTEWAQEKGFLL